MKKFLVPLTGLALSSAVCAQDFLQQWRDSAAAIEMPGADPRSIEKPLLAAVCSATL